MPRFRPLYTTLLPFFHRKEHSHGRQVHRYVLQRHYCALRRQNTLSRKGNLYYIFSPYVALAEGRRWCSVSAARNTPPNMDSKPRPIAFGTPVSLQLSYRSLRTCHCCRCDIPPPCSRFLQHARYNHQSCLPVVRTTPTLHCLVLQISCSLTMKLISYTNSPFLLSGIQPVVVHYSALPVTQPHYLCPYR